MNEELMITKEDLVNWLNRPPSNDDLDLIGFITTRLENFYKLEQENKQLKKEIIKIVVDNLTQINIERESEFVSLILKLIQEKEQKINKAIEYIESIDKVEIRWFDYDNFHKYHLISQEELKERVEEENLEGHFIEVNKNKLLSILGDK